MTAELVAAGCAACSRPALRGTARRRCPSSDATRGDTLVETTASDD